jgi:hypothetical protein
MSPSLLDAPSSLDRSRSTTASGPPFPVGVAESLSYLANLIDDSIRVRGTGVGVREWAAAFLGIAPTDLAVTAMDPSLFVSQLMAIALAADLDEHPPSAVIGEDQEEAPTWVKLELGEVTTRVPCDLAACFAAGGLVLPPVVVQVTRPYNSPGLAFRVYSRREHAPAAEAYLEALRERTRQGANPFKGRTLETVNTQMGLTFRVVPPVTTRRRDVVLPARIWAEVDRNVHGLYRALDRLQAADSRATAVCCSPARPARARRRCAGPSRTSSRVGSPSSSATRPPWPPPSARCTSSCGTWPPRWW